MAMPGQEKHEGNGKIEVHKPPVEVEIVEEEKRKQRVPLVAPQLPDQQQHGQREKKEVYGVENFVPHLHGRKHIQASKKQKKCVGGQKDM